MTEPTVFSFELTSLRHKVHSMFADYLGDIDRMIGESLEKQLTEEWVMGAVETSVREILAKAVKGIHDDPIVYEKVRQKVIDQFPWEEDECQ